MKRDNKDTFRLKKKEFRINSHGAVIKATSLLVLCIITLTNLGVELIFRIKNLTDDSVYKGAHTAATVMPLLLAFPVIYFIFRLLWKLNKSYLIIEELSRTDSLTKVFNRRYFEELGKRESALAERSGKPISLLMLDLDHFKKINDKYGHTTGDKVLVELVKRLRQTLRSTDITARYGGEEFIILLPETDPSQALQTAERILKGVNSSPFQHKEQQISFTVSIGVASSSANNYIPEVLIKSADKALYKAKRNGRNQIAV